MQILVGLSQKWRILAVNEQLCTTPRPSWDARFTRIFRIFQYLMNHIPENRLAYVDMARGLALVAMIAYHFSFDLAWFGFLHVNFYTSPVAIVVRDLIVTSFLLVCGMSLTLATRHGFRAKKFWKREAYIVGCALLVSAASALAFPRSWIYFGILHCIAVSSVLALPFMNRFKTAFVVGVGVILIGAWAQHPWFDWLPASVIGFTTAPPPTEDYAPIFPWFGVVLLGMALQQILLTKKIGTRLGARKMSVGQVLGMMGRHSLVIYMVHQPILIGGVALAHWLTLPA
jgi:uncharacterized membrane protein